MPRVSVIIPCYNSELFLSEALESVLGQNFEDFEVVTIDDGSTDGTRAVLNRFSDSCLIKMFQGNQGVGKARNAAIARSTAEYLAFLDSDDVWEPDKLAQQVAFLDAHLSVALVYSDCFVIDSSGTILKKFSDDFRLQRGMIFEKLLQENFVPLSTVVMRRAVFDDVGPFLPYSIVEDYDLFLRCAARYPFGFLPQPLARYRRHPSNITRNLRLAVAELNCVYDDLLRREPPLRDSVLRAKGWNLYLIGKTALYDGSRSDALSFLAQSVRAHLTPWSFAYLILAAFCGFRPVQMSLLGVRRALKRTA
jgi:glycosyltransferase involved in cell wall biosynthesis